MGRRSAAVVAWRLCGAGVAWLAWLDVGVCVGVFLVPAVPGVMGCPLFGARQFVLPGGAWLVARCSALMVVRGPAAVGGCGWVFGVCAPGSRGIGLGRIR